MAFNVPDYKPNSHKSKEGQEAKTERKVEAVAKAKVKKKSDIRKFGEVFIAEDVSNVKSYVLFEVLGPTIKKAVSDIVKNSVDMLLFGEVRDNKRRASGDYVSYRSYSDRDRRDDRRPTSRSRFGYDDLIFDTRSEAEIVLDKMDELIDQFDFVTVADLYDMVDITAPYTANKYGWRNISSARVERVRDGYILRLPMARIID